MILSGRKYQRYKTIYDDILDLLHAYWITGLFPLSQAQVRERRNTNKNQNLIVWIENRATKGNALSQL